MEKAGTLTGGHYSLANGVLLTYAVDDVSSLSSLHGWKENALRYTENAVFFMVGNKIDVPNHDIEVRDSTIAAFCEKHHISESNVFKVSAKTDEGIAEMFKKITQVLDFSEIPTTRKQSGFNIQPGDEPDGKKCC